MGRRSGGISWRINRFLFLHGWIYLVLGGLGSLACSALVFAANAPRGSASDEEFFDPDPGLRLGTIFFGSAFAITGVVILVVTVVVTIADRRAARRLRAYEASANHS